MSDVVVDASLAVQWSLEEEHTTEARRLLGEREATAGRRVAPSRFACEVGNVLYRRIVRGRIGLGRARIAVDPILGQVVTVDVEPAITRRASEFADRFGHGVVVRRAVSGPCRASRLRGLDVGPTALAIYRWRASLDPLDRRGGFPVAAMPPAA